MIVINRIGDSITGSANGKNFGVRYQEEKYKKMKALEREANEAVSMEALKSILEEFEALTQEDYKEVVEHECKHLFVNEATGQFFLKLNDGTVSDRPLPQVFVNRILTSVEKGIDFLPIVKAAIRFMRNPKYSQEKFDKFARYVDYQTVDRDLMAELIEKHGVSQDVAMERATFYQTPITQEGLICTYKYSEEITHKFDRKTGEKIDRYEKEYDEDTGEVTSDGTPEYVEDRIFRPAIMGDSGDPFVCEMLGDEGKPGHVIKVGCEHYLEDWDQVNCDDDLSGVKGLHVGNIDYVQGFGGFGRVLHNVFVDPMYIGAITDDGSGALRVLRYFVHSSHVAPNRGIYHSSKYAAHTDGEWEKMKEEAIENVKKHQEKLAKQIEQTNAL